MRTSCLATALGLALSLLPVQLPAQDPSQKMVERWRADLQRQEELLRRQKWEKVAEDARRMVQEMVDSLLSGQPSATLLAHALIQQAVAESGLGHQADAVWLLHLAQNLDARYREVPLGSYGPVGSELERFWLRQAGTAPAAWPTLPAEGSFQPPRVLRQGASYTPEALARFLIAGDIEVEMVVGPDGRVLEPVLLTEPEFPTLAFVLLDSLREWRFEPARVSGKAVPALFRARISHGRLQKMVEASSSNRHQVESWEAAEKRLAEFDERLRKGKGQAVHAEVRKLISELDAHKLESRLLAEGLRALALAEAGSGRQEEAVWHWQVAQNLRSDLELDAAAYGEAGAFLARHKLRHLGEAPAGLEVVDAAHLGAGSTPPRKIAGDEPVVPEPLDTRRTPRWVWLEAVIDPQGRVIEPVVRAGRSQAMRWAVLEAVRTWRFEPAQREGQPVAVLLDIRLPVRDEIPLAEMLPFTGELGSVHVLIQRQEWKAARTRAAAAVQSVGNRSDADPRQQAAALALLALADAGSGGSSSACYWHAAQALYGDLYHAGLDAYGTAGALLEASDPWRRNEEIPRVGMTVAGETVVQPEKIKGGSVPQYSEQDRRAGVRGTIIMEVVVEEDGRVSQPWLLKGVSPGTDLLALQAICEWRFKPAKAGGRPVKVYYVLTVNYEVGRG